MGNNFWPNSNKGKRFRIMLKARGTPDPWHYVTGIREEAGRVDVRHSPDRSDGLVRESVIAHELAATIRRRLPGFIVETEVVK